MLKLLLLSLVHASLQQAGVKTFTAEVFIDLSALGNASIENSQFTEIVGWGGGISTFCNFETVYRLFFFSTFKGRAGELANFFSGSVS